MKKFKKDNKGFSLVELIVVIAIMAVLVGVLAPALLGNIEKSKEAKDIQVLDSIAAAAQYALGDPNGNEAAGKAPYVSSTGSTQYVIIDKAMVDTNAFGKLVIEYLGNETVANIKASLTSKSANESGNNIYIKVDNNKVEVCIANAADEVVATATAVTASKSGDTFKVER